MRKSILLLAFLVAATAASVFFYQDASASNVSPVLYQLQTGASTSATQEYISIYNNNDEPVDVTNWCLTYSSASDASQTTLGCFVPPDNHTKLMLSSHGVALWASNEFVTAHPGFVSDVVFASGISGTSGHVRLVNAGKQEIDRLGWGAALHPEGVAAVAPAMGKILERIGTVDDVRQDSDNNSSDFAQAVLLVLPNSGIYEEDVPVDVCPNIPDLQSSLPDGYLLDGSGNCQQDICLNIDGLQVTIPSGYESLDGENCTPVPLEGAILLIAELLPDVTSTDSGKEFIELHNPNNRAVSLNGYTLQLGPNFTTSYSFSSQSIEAGAYMAFSDSQTGITLPNTSASLRLIAPNGAMVSETASYNAPGEDVSWAVINGVWQATYQPTPNAANILLASKPCPAGQERSAETGSCRTISGGLGGDGLVPCQEGQERNPDTNRCRTVASLASSLVPCSVGQERNPDTNRCRSIVSTASALVPCKEGQERNPETNRCRSVASTASALQPCAAGQERNPDTNRCRKISTASSGVGGLASVKDAPSGPIKNNPRWWLAGVVSVGAVGYAFYEWRQEILGSLVKAKRWIPGLTTK